MVAFESAEYSSIAVGMGLAILTIAIATGLILLWWHFYRRSIQRLADRIKSSQSRAIAGVDFSPIVRTLALALLRVLSFCFVVLISYLCVTVVLGRFAYTAPWSKELETFFLQTLLTLGTGFVSAMPGLFVVVLIFLLARGLVRILYDFFQRIEMQTATVTWLDPETARATRRIAAALVWGFALVVAYPYIPGSETAAFKGLSVFIGLVISLGSTGFVSQIMSGIVVIYSRTLRAGDYVITGEDEGIVTEVGLLSTKLTNPWKEEIVIPNSRIGDPARRSFILSELHSRIQDAFNEAKIQIMSPHFVQQPEKPVLGAPQ